MQFTFVSAHSVQGIVHKGNVADLLLYDDAKGGLRVTVTAEPNRHLRVINRQLAIASMMFRGMIREPLDDEFHRNLADQIAEIENQRLDGAGTDGVVVIQVKGDVIASIPPDARAIDDLLLCFDAFDKKELRLRLLPQVSGVLTALRLGGRRNYKFRSLAEGSYLTTLNGKIVHSFSMEGGSVEMYVSSPLNEAELERVSGDISLIIKAGNLERVVRLYTQSLNRATDNYRSFIAAWSSLEILVGKIFPVYHQLLAAELQKVSQAPGLHAYLDRVMLIMGGKHNLADKFSVISMFLDDEGNPEEIKTFRKLKNVRDHLSHGEELPEDSLPTTDVQRLFDKYLRNHLRYGA
jgi:hypothetical protein